MNLFDKLNIGKRLGASFFLVLTMLLVVAAAGMHGISRTTEDLRTMYEDRAIPVELIGDLNRLMLRNRVLVMDMMAFPDAKNFEKRNAEFMENVEQVTQTWERFAKTGMTAETRVVAEEFLKWRKRYVSEGLVPVRDAVQAGNLEEARRIYKEGLSPVAADVAKAQAALSASEIGDGRREYEAAQAQSRTLLQVSFGVAVLAVMLGGLLAWLITRSITRPLAQAVSIAEAVAKGDLTVRDVRVRNDETGRLLSALQFMVKGLVDIVGTVRASSDSIATGSAQIATGNADLSQRTEEQASNLQQTAASMEQLSSTVKNNADAARQAAQLANEANSVAAKGSEVVGQVVSTMGEITQSSQRIADIIGVIDGIAFQTNILALNAAVEAARAGEQGRGFAVVAGEVRTLAKRSADAAREIKSLIDTSVQRVEDGSRLVVNAGSTMEDIMAQVRKVNDLIAEISSATIEQNSGIGQVSDAVSQLDQATQQNAALVEESAAAAESLNQQAARLVKAVQVFKLDA